MDSLFYVYGNNQTKNYNVTVSMDEKKLAKNKDPSCVVISFHLLEGKAQQIDKKTEIMPCHEKWSYAHNFGLQILVLLVLDGIEMGKKLSLGFFPKGFNCSNTIFKQFWLWFING